jgi:hypothetical protein
MVENFGAFNYRGSIRPASFKGLGLRDCVQRLGIPSATCPSSEIITHYEAGNYAEIVEHVTEDVLNTEKLFNHLAGASV